MNQENTEKTFTVTFFAEHGRRGGKKTAEMHGKKHFIDMAKKRWHKAKLGITQFTNPLHDKAE